MIRPLLGRDPTPRASVRIELHQGDVCAMEVIEDGDLVRLAIYDERSATPLIAAELSRDERRQLVSALVGVDLTPNPHG